MVYCNFRSRKYSAAGGGIWRKKVPGRRIPEGRFKLIPQVTISPAVTGRSGRAIGGALSAARSNVEALKLHDRGTLLPDFRFGRDGTPGSGKAFIDTTTLLCYVSAVMHRG